MLYTRTGCQRFLHNIGLNGLGSAIIPILKELMSSILSKDLKYDNAEPIKSSEVRLRGDEAKGDMGEEDDAVNDKVDDMWKEDEELPAVEYYFDDSLEEMEMDSSNGQGESLERKEDEDLETVTIEVDDEIEDEKGDDREQDTNDPVQDSDQIEESRNTEKIQRKTIQSEKKKQEETIKAYHERHGSVDTEPYEPSGPSKKTQSEKFNLKKHKEGDLTDFVKGPHKPIEIYQQGAQLNGTDRVAADGIASEEECKTLIKLIKMESLAGDGYNDTPYVHTKYELFEGLTVKQATDAAKDGRLSMYYPLTYMHVAERSRQFVEDYFNIKQRLFFSYTHLVCRTAEPDSTSVRKDLSHPIHADNCQLDHWGKCHKKAPAFTWRDYSAITYLNDDFVGGDFVFAHANQTVQAVVKPTCGRIVAFSAGEENLHGVKGVIKGRRCALALWFTLDSRYREMDFFHATTTINELYQAVHGKKDEL